MNVSEEKGISKQGGRALWGLGGHKQNKDYSALEKEITTKKSQQQKQDYKSEGKIIGELGSFLGKSYIRAEEIFGEDYGNLIEEKRKNRMHRANAFLATLKELEGAYGHEKTLFAAENLCANQFFNLLLAGSYISEKDNKASLIPTSLTGKILEALIAIEGLGTEATKSITLLCRRAVLENTLIGRTTNLDRITQFASLMQKTKSARINEALIKACEKHPEIFVEEQKTKAFLSIVTRMIPVDSAREEELVSFISDEAAGLWRLASENRSGDYINNPLGFLRVHRATRKHLPKGYPETIEDAISKYLKSVGGGLLEEALKNFYAWEILLMERNGLDASELATNDRINEFTTLLALTPRINESLKDPQFPAGESNQTFQLLDALFKTYALVYENAGVYYPQTDAKEIASVLVQWRASSNEPMIALAKENDKYVPANEKADKKTLEFWAAETFSVRASAYGKTWSGDWSQEPNHWTGETRKALALAFAELQKKGIGFIAASAGCYKGALTQGCALDLRVYVKAEETTISREKICGLIRQNLDSRGISLSCSKTELIYMAKEAESIRFRFGPKDMGAYVLLPGKQQLVPSKAGDIGSELIVWFDGKTMPSKDYMRSELSTIMSCLCSAVELSVDDKQRIEHYSVALTRMEDLFRESQETFKELLTEAYRELDNLADDEEIYIHAIVNLSGADRKALKELIRQNKKTNPHLQPDYRGGLWHDHISSLKEGQAH